MASEEIDPQPYKYWPSIESLKVYGQKTYKRHYYLSTLPKAFDSIHRGKMEQIQLAYGGPKETVAAITVLYRNTKVKVRSPDGDTEYFDIVAGVLQGDTEVPYLFIICLDYVLRISIDKIRENGFELTKKRSRMYPATTITDAVYADDIALLANTPNQAETLLHSLERSAACNDLHVNAHKAVYVLHVNAQKTVYVLQPNRRHFHTRRNLSETIRQIHLPRKQCLINRKRHRHTTNESMDSWKRSNIEQVLAATPHKAPTIRPFASHHETIQVRRTRHAGYCWRSKDTLISDVLQWTPAYGQAKAGRPARTYIQQLCEDTGCSPEDQLEAMNEREK